MSRKETKLTKILPDWKERIKRRKYQDDSVRYYIHIGRALQKQIGANHDYLSATTIDDLIEKLYEAFYGAHSKSLNSIISEYIEYRTDVKTNPNTVKREHYLWEKHFKNLPFANVPLTEITPAEIRDVFLAMTGDYQMTNTAFKNVKGLLNGIFTYCLEKEYIERNPMDTVNYKKFAKRFKPTPTDHDNYSAEERSALIQYFRNQERVGKLNSYDYAVWFAFNSFIRIGEIKALKPSDFHDGIYTVNKAIVQRQEVITDEDGNIKFGHLKTMEAFPKGNSAEGIRNLPMNGDIYHIVDTMVSKYPENEYLFMSNGKPIQTKEFNDHLKKACKALNIPYRSSHKIRFTNCDALYYYGGVDIRDMQSFMGHTSATMTEHYFNQHSASADGFEKVRKYLTVPAESEENPCIA